MPLPPRAFLSAVRFNDADFQPMNWSSASWHTPGVSPPFEARGVDNGFSFAEITAGCTCPGCGGRSPSEPQYFMPPQSGTAANGLPIFNWTEAAVQITRESNGWAGLGNPAVVSYGFRLTEPGGTENFSQFSQAQIAATVEVLSLWSEVANITFNRVGTGYTDSATMLFANYNSETSEAAAFAYYPGSTLFTANAGDVWVNLFYASNLELAEGEYGAHILAHEIGHAIGLAHPADYDASDPGDPAYPGDADYWQDSRMFTVMSYFGSAGPGGSLNAFSSGPQLHDIAAAQRLYGANTTTRTGDTVYGFNSNAGHARYLITADGQSPVFAIWDAGGNDTIDFSGYTTQVEIDLREEAFSSAGPGNMNTGVAIGNISIARGAIIENGIAGSANDVLIGNNFANLLNGGAGADTMTGGFGNDIYVVDNGGDVVTEGLGEGTDTIRSFVGVTTLAANVENLELQGLAITGNGNALANVITGNAQNNSINGQGGADTMSGGLGNDTYFVDNIGDAVVEASGEGTDIIFSTVDVAALAANIENLTISALALSATGNALNNTIAGNAQNNTLNGGSGEDTLIGGIGNDLYIVNSLGDVVTEGLGAGADSILAFIDINALVANVENVTLAGTAVSATGNELSNIITGNGLDNTLVGGLGGDQLNGGVGADTMSGGDGDDAYLVENAGDVTIELSGEGAADIVYAFISLAALGDNIERLTITGTGNLDATGNALGNRVNGNANNNVLVGLGGNDVIQGLAGVDTINGGSGLDIMTGGADADTFVFSLTTDSGVTGATRDVINDFAQGSDVISLAAIDAITGGGDDAFTLIGTAAFSNTAGQLRYDQIDNASGADYTIISMDVNGDGIADSQITLVGLVTLTVSDFGL